MGKCCSKGKVLPGDGSTDSAKGVMQRPEMKRMAPEDRPVFKTGITDDYTFFLNEPLGRGSFGIVFKAKGKDDDKTYAVKCVQKSAMTDDDREDLFREVKIMGLLGNSLNIVYLYDAYEDEQNYYLVMEYCSGGQLFSRVKRFNRRYNEARVASLMRSILQVCAQCHSKNIIYRDVKPENFLFLNDDPDSPIKATDFGLAVHKPPGTPALKLRAGTPAYMAPEVVNRDYGKEADIWSCGVIAYQLLTGRFPFRGTAIPTYASRKVDPNSTLGHMQSMYADIRANDADFSGDAWKTISRQGKDFVKKLLHKDPRKRLTAADALNHPWMAVAEEQEDESGYVSGGSQSGRNDNELGDTVVQRLQLFSSYGHIKQALLNDISQRLPGPAHEAKTRQLEAAQRLFHEMDEAKTGSLSQEDLQKGLWNAGFKLAESEVQQIIAAIDLTGTGEISLDEFEAALVDWRGIVDEVGEEEWQAAAVNHFREMDTAGSGYVTVNSIALPEGGDKAAKKGTGTHSRASRSNSTNSPSVAAAVLREKDFLALVEPKEDLKHFDKRLAGRAEPLADSDYDENLLVELFKFSSALTLLPGLTSRRPDAVFIAAEINFPETPPGGLWDGLRYDPSAQEPFFARTAYTQRWAARFTGQLVIQRAATYTFFLECDDGAGLWLDGTMVVANDGNHPMLERKGMIALAEGPHDLRVEYFQDIDASGLVLSYSAPGMPKQIVPASQLSSPSGHCCSCQCKGQQCISRRGEAGEAISCWGADCADGNAPC